MEDALKAVILAGGKGTRLSEETVLRPKPLVEAGSQPLIWHIMQNYARFGVTEFIVLVGHKGQQIREYFANFWLQQSDVTFDLSSPIHEIQTVRQLPWKVTVLDTGNETQTGGRINQLKGKIEGDFFLTYGDGVSDVNIEELQKFHVKHNKTATLTAVQPAARYGALNLDNSKVLNFKEKPQGEGAWINGGYFVLSTKVFEYLPNEDCSFEFDILPRLAQAGELEAFKHHGFWQPVDTVRDLQKLEESVRLGVLPWI